MAHTVVRTDMLAGTVNPAYLENGRYVKDGAYADIDNGSIVMVGALEDGERESHVYSDVTADATIDSLVLIVVPETFKDTTTHKEDVRDFYVKKGVCARGYRLTPGAEFSLTADGIDGNPTKGAAIGVDAKSHKCKVGGTVKIGTIIDIDVKNYMTYYTIQVSK